MDGRTDRYKTESRPSLFADLTIPPLLSTAALDKLSGAAGSPAGKGEESEMGDVFANDSTEEANFVPVFMGFAAVLACIAWHLQNIQA